MKLARSTGEISGLLIACFFATSVYFYASASSGPLIIDKRSSVGMLKVQTPSVNGDDHIISGTKGNVSLNYSKTPTLSCDSNYRSTVCEIYSNARIHGNSSSIYFNSLQIKDSETEKIWRIRPYTRKFDTFIMKNVREVTIRSLQVSRKAPKCDVHHNVTAIVFALTGYTGNYFHAFSDVLLPLFITARQFEGEAQLLIADMKLWLIGKYRNVLSKLSNYEIIDFNKDNKVRCYPRAIVGLHSHGELTMDPSRTPHNYTMVDFARLMKRAYSLERDFAVSLVAHNNKKPRLLIISRSNTRKFINVGEIVALAEQLGFEVVVNEASSQTDLGEFARMVNTFDVMMGVHGAGLTNLVFLPTNAVVIQIVPFGKFERVAEEDFGEAARNMMLRYIQYSISEEESTLIDLYPKDHAVFRDPKSIHKQGWPVLSKIYLSQQNVKLNTTRFRPVLTSALGQLGQLI